MTTSTDYDVVVLDRDLPAVHGDRGADLEHVEAESILAEVDAIGASQITEAG